jgi:hypothetical protein
VILLTLLGDKRIESGIRTMTEASTTASTSQLPPRPTLDNISSTDFLALQAKLKEFNDWMDMPGVNGLHKQDAETRKYYNDREAEYRSSIEKAREAIQNHVGVEGFTQFDANEMMETIESTTVPMSQKRGYGCFIASSLKMNEMAIQRQEDLKEQLKRKATEMENMTNATFGSSSKKQKQERIEDSFTPKSTSAFLSKERAPVSFEPKSSKVTPRSNQRQLTYTREDDMDEEEGPQYINILQRDIKQEDGVKKVHLGPSITQNKHIYKMLGESAYKGIALDAKYAHLFDQVSNAFKAQHEVM